MGPVGPYTRGEFVEVRGAMGETTRDAAGVGSRAGGTTYGDRLQRAFTVAATLHASQRRKATNIPYVSHLLGTCAIALEHGANEDEAIAALLHDAIEDVTPVEEARSAVGSFGAEVLRIVEGCTDADTHPKPPWRARKERYIRHLASVDRSILLVSASDKLHNARSILSDLHRPSVGVAVWGRFNASRDDVLWYYRALTDAYRANAAHHEELVGELRRTVDGIARFPIGPRRGITGDRGPMGDGGNG